MFNLFKKWRKNPEEIRKEAMQKLFPLDESKSKYIESILNQVVGQNYIDEDGKSVLDFVPKFASKLIKVWDLEFDCFNWDEQLNYKKEEDLKIRRIWFGDCFPAVLQILATQEEYIPPFNDRQLEKFRDSIRNESFKVGGGLIYCDFGESNGNVIAESIFKVPKDEGPGMDYIYRITIPNYDNYQNYILNFKVHEMAPTGVRDNILLQPIAEMMELSIEMLFDKKLYWEDPYDSSIKEGNRMNISEREEFDSFVPHHPLSIIRQHIRKRILPSIVLNSNKSI